MSTGFSLKQALLGGLFLFSAVSAAPIQSANLEASGTLSQRSELNERADVNGIMAGVNVIVQNSMIANVPGIMKGVDMIVAASTGGKATTTPTTGAAPATSTTPKAKTGLFGRKRSLQARDNKDSLEEDDEEDEEEEFKARRVRDLSEEELEEQEEEEDEEEEANAKPRRALTEDEEEEEEDEDEEE